MYAWRRPFVACNTYSVIFLSTQHMDRNVHYLVLFFWVLTILSSFRKFYLLIIRNIFSILFRNEKKFHLQLVNIYTKYILKLEKDYIGIWSYKQYYNLLSTCIDIRTNPRRFSRIYSPNLVVESQFCARSHVLSCKQHIIRPTIVFMTKDTWHINWENEYAW